jgi:hypothetical protein
LFKSDFKFSNLKAGYANPRPQTILFSLFFFFLADQGEGRRSAGDLPLEVKELQKKPFLLVFFVWHRGKKGSPSPCQNFSLSL